MEVKVATGTALKLTKVLERIDVSDGEEEEDDDTEVALMTKMVRKWFKKKAGQGEASSSIKRDLKSTHATIARRKGTLLRRAPTQR